MSQPLRVLAVEDNESDWKLLLRLLERADYRVTHQRVDTSLAMTQALAEPWDAVISDYSMPQFSAPAALRLLRESGQEIPFIIVSGTIGEETAVAALKAGAHDFLLKHQLARFVPALERELREAAERRERRKIEAALHQSELRYRRIVETAQEGIWMLDGAGCTTYVNKRMAELLGSPAESLLGTPASAFVDPPHAVGDAAQHELEFRRGDGSTFWASVSTTQIHDDSGARTGSLSMVNDVTERRKLTEQLMVSDRMASVGALAAGVAHEINNPMVVILANVDMASQVVRDQLAAPSPDRKELQGVSEMLADVAEAGRRVTEIVKDLKIFSRGDERETGPVSVRRVADSALRLAKNEVRHRARLVVNVPAQLEVEANESQLGQVLVNLIVNAAQAIGDGAAATNEIELSARVEDGQTAVLQVRDTGAGMTPEVLRRLFTPFFTTKPLGVGTGLGLAICRRIVTSFGGSISAASEVGQGSSFSVRLPLAGESVSAPTSEPGPPPGPAPDPARAAPPPEPKTRRGRVLLVDDERLIALVLHRILDRDYDVSSTTRARDALERIVAGERYDIILCDLMMPQMTGAQLYQELAQACPEQARRMIFLTGGVFTEEMIAFVANQKNEVLEKPFDPDKLSALLAERIRDS